MVVQQKRRSKKVYPKSKDRKQSSIFILQHRHHSIQISASCVYVSSISLSYSYIYNLLLYWRWVVIDLFILTRINLVYKLLL